MRIPVKAVAELVHRRGHLHARLDGRTRAEEGIAAQRRLQQGRPESYQRERSVSLAVTLAGIDVVLGGRIDGCDASGERIVLEEVKATRADPDLAHAHHASVHWAQVRLYAALLARELGDGRDFELRLLYCHPETLETRAFSRTESAGEVLTFLDRTLDDFRLWLERQREHETHRNECLQRLAFPFPEFRPFQRAMTRRVYRALRDREHLLLEAPTGSGKTSATLFPALRALESAGYRRIVFLTSRTTGALAVRDAVGRMDSDGKFLRRVQIIAREKACFEPGTPCEPDACPYAHGYYDRFRPAVIELLERRALDPDTVADTARVHRVCPFELSLDAAAWCDLIVADYNYLFDPLVRLQRLAGDPETALLVDEAHQLAPRVREMLSLELDRSAVREALAEAPPPALLRRLRSLDRAFAALKRQQSLGEERVIERPEAILRSMQRLVEEAAEQPLAALPDSTRELLFACHRWLRSQTWYDPERFRFLGRAAGRSVVVRLVCLDPGPYIRERFAEYGGHVRFSGTVSPLALYARLHGEADAPAERAGNPFGPEQLAVLVVDDVPVYLRQRERSLGALVQLLHDVVEARTGHYLVAFPSFDYLTLAADAFAAAYPEANLIRQTPGMTDAERQAFLDAFRPGAPARLGFVVLGGVFAESVDFAEARLAGVVCVGVGLPPPSLARVELERHFSGQGIDGTTVAYTQPAMVKVLQMAGRLLRSPNDRGVLCLVDERFRAPAYRQFFPDHWHPRRVRACGVAAELEAFWRTPDSGDYTCSGGTTRLPALKSIEHL